MSFIFEIRTNFVTRIVFRVFLRWNGSFGIGMYCLEFGIKEAGNWIAWYRRGEGGTGGRGWAGLSPSAARVAHRIPRCFITTAKH